MKYEDFEKFVRETCVYETIYDDSDGRQILIISMLDAYGMVDKALRARLAQPKPDYEAEFIKDWNEGKVRRVSDGKRMVPEREWVGLTDDERNHCLVEADPCEALADPEAQQLMIEIEATLKDKNNG